MKAQSMARSAEAPAARPSPDSKRSFFGKKRGPSSEAKGKDAEEAARKEKEQKADDEKWLKSQIELAEKEYTVERLRWREQQMRRYHTDIGVQVKVQRERAGKRLAVDEMPKKVRQKYDAYLAALETAGKEFIEKAEGEVLKDDEGKRAVHTARKSMLARETLRDFYLKGDEKILQQEKELWDTRRRTAEERVAKRIMDWRARHPKLNFVLTRGLLIGGAAGTGVLAGPALALYAATSVLGGGIGLIGGTALGGLVYRKSIKKSAAFRKEDRDELLKDFSLKDFQLFARKHQKIIASTSRDERRAIRGAAISAGVFGLLLGGSATQAGAAVVDTPGFGKTIDERFGPKGRIDSALEKAALVAEEGKGAPLGPQGYRVPSYPPGYPDQPLGEPREANIESPDKHFPTTPSEGEAEKLLPPHPYLTGEGQAYDQFVRSDVKPPFKPGYWADEHYQPDKPYIPVPPEIPVEEGMQELARVPSTPETPLEDPRAAYPVIIKPGDNPWSTMNKFLKSLDVPGVRPGEIRDATNLLNNKLVAEYAPGKWKIIATDAQLEKWGLTRANLEMFKDGSWRGQSIDYGGMLRDEAVRGELAKTLRVDPEQLTDRELIGEKPKVSVPPETLRRPLSEGPSLYQEATRAPDGGRVAAVSPDTLRLTAGALERADAERLFSQKGFFGIGRTSGIEVLDRIRNSSAEGVLASFDNKTFPLSRWEYDQVKQHLFNLSKDTGIDFRGKSVDQFLKAAYEVKARGK